MTQKMRKKLNNQPPSTIRPAVAAAQSGMAHPACLQQQQKQEWEGAALAALFRQFERRYASSARRADPLHPTGRCPVPATNLPSPSSSRNITHNNPPPQKICNN